MMEPPSKRTEVRRLAERGTYDRALIEAVLDEALICHVGFVHDGSPVVIPTIHARVGDTVYLHGSPAGRFLRTLATTEAEVCLTVTLIDGLVVAKAAVHNSMNYRSVVLFAAPRRVDDRTEKLLALEALTEHVLPGRWADSRPVTDKEIKGTLVVALPIDEASAKFRADGPKDDVEDTVLPIWAGVLPVTLELGSPVPDGTAPEGTPIPDYLETYRRPRT
jgi:nitroimidazol reductase NimA-like FMN-containing flavoprotein (pyridoxamine 5'-phosphate oxidase superfamily)